MARKMFTDEQVQSMQENPYTLSVSTTQIKFTLPFKEEFWHLYRNGDTPRTILYKLGYDPKVLGKNRLSGIQNAICQQAASAEGFTEGTQRNTPNPHTGDTTQAQLNRMQHQIKYLEQEVEFLKKISSARGMHKRGPQP